jgi:hypothetical protein
MATTEQVTINAQDLRAAGQAVQDLPPKDPVELSRTDGLINLTWQSNGTTGVTIHEGRAFPSDE